MRISAVEALSRLRRLGKTVITTSDASLHLGQTRSAASWTLARFAATGLIRRIRHGLWSLDPEIDPLLLPEHLTAPYPAYVSFQSALRVHGMISQIPHVIYVASLAPTRKINTHIGTYSIHRIAPSFFGGFETIASGVRIARPEKALLDVLYLGPARSRLFAHLPEIELTEDFSESEALRWLEKVPTGLRRSMMERRLDSILGSARKRHRSAAGSATRTSRRESGPKGT